MLKSFLCRLSLIVALAPVLAGCGSGDSGTCMLDCPPPPPPPAGEYSLSYRVVYADEKPFDTSTDALQFGKPVRIYATLTNSKGEPQPAQVVSFAVSDSSAAKLTSNGSILTDKAGTGYFSVDAASPSSAGAVTITGTAKIESGGVISETSRPISFRINEADRPGDQPPGTPAFVKYVSASPVRLFVRGGALGSANASEESVVSFKVLDVDGVSVKDAVVEFNVTKWTGGILLNGVTNQTVRVVSDTTGVAKVTVTSGTEPVSINVQAKALTSKAPAAETFTKETYSDEQIIISGRKPDQFKFFLAWEASATCGTGVADRVYPCKFIVYVGDEKGDPVADGTVVNMVSDTGLVIAEKQAGQPSGACLTVNSQCVGEYTGKPSIDRGAHRVVAYAVGNYVNSPKNYPSEPITFDGSWVASGGFVSDGGNVVVTNANASKDADSYVRNCLRDNTTENIKPFNACMTKQ